MTITIYGEVPSSKNTLKFGKTKAGKRVVYPTKLTKGYNENTELQWIAHRDKFLKAVKGLDKPYSITFKFYRRTKGRFDYVNIVQSACDLMVKHKWLDDDNANELIPVFEQYEVDKLNPRCEIKLKQGDL